MVQGKAHKYPDNVDTDVIIPARYLNTADHKELAAHCMEDIDAQFKNNVRPGDVMAAGWNFGCGSSREHAPIAISFARKFYLTSIHIGLPIFECEAASDGIAAGDEVRVDFDTGLITNLTKNETYQAQPLPPFIQNIVNRGGLLNSLK